MHIDFEMALKMIATSMCRKSIIHFQKKGREHMFNASEVFEKNYKDYCAQIAKINFTSITEKLGIEQEDDKLLIPFYNKNHLISNDGVTDISGIRPDYIVCVILAKYILLCPKQPHHDNKWVSFKDFKKTSHFLNVNYFKSDTEQAIVNHFSGRIGALAKACEESGGFHHEMDISYDLSMQFNALPHISLLLLFNDGDEEFPAQCTVLFQKHAEFFLDPESLAMTSACLAKRLKESAK